MQPLDKRVFGPLKQQWYKTVRKHNREQPGVTINKIHFAEKLKICYNDFYKPSTVVISFRSSGIYPVNRAVIVDAQLKTNYTFSEPIEKKSDKNNEDLGQEKGAVDVHEKVFHVFESVLSTPVTRKYEQRINEKYDVTGVFRVYDKYKLLKSKVKPRETADDVEPSTSSSTNQAGLNERNFNIVSDFSDKL
ncbi:hypothetical protein DPMN_154845 [Dreissena polymorpha]|uniref:Uncharacterized protein n=1 Tax=Dreissena polymorpha TaxID=45954 RepID=A0A9D4JAB9_DREPO|nr:hypothetical protein DPMN_154845 [Dreissena polymorpha]